MDSNKTILLLEDDLVDVMTIQRAMSQLGIKNPLVVKSNGEEGQSFLATATERPHLILLDINMPKMNGLEFLAMLKKNPESVSYTHLTLPTSP
jgi:CheY-like chemotaxis protein